MHSDGVLQRIEIGAGRCYDLSGAVKARRLLFSGCWGRLALGCYKARIVWGFGLQ